MKKFTSIITALFICISLIVSASAATVSSVSHSSTQKGGNTATTFYVNANNKNTTKLNYNCKYGVFNSGDSVGYSESIRGYFEVKIWGRNSTSAAWNYISKTNYKNISYTTVSMKGYTQYKVSVYAWKTPTISQNRYGKSYSNARWTHLPTCTFTKNSNVKSLAK